VDVVVVVVVVVEEQKYYSIHKVGRFPADVESREIHLRITKNKFKRFSSWERYNNSLFYIYSTNFYPF
jgi:hypothetical protein